MQSSSLILSSGFHPFSSSKGRKSSLFSSSSARRVFGRDNFGGRMVDENMIVLRKRIGEMRKIERKQEAPSDWMEWEKRCYKSYDSVVCEAMGVLQRVLMNSRPSLALGILAFLALSLPVSAAFLFFHLVQLGQLLLGLAGIHLN